MSCDCGSGGGGGSGFVDSSGSCADGVVMALVVEVAVVVD